MVKQGRKFTREFKVGVVRRIAAEGKLVAGRPVPRRVRSCRITINSALAFRGELQSP